MNSRLAVLDFRFCGHLPRRRRADSEWRRPGSKFEGQKSSRFAGFTLIEVLVGLAVFAMAAVALGSAYLNILNSYEAVARAARVSEDLEFARQIVLTEPDRTKLENGGDFETTGGQRARWDVAIEPTLLADLFKVTLTCEVPDPARPEPARSEQSFTLLRPTWSIDPAERDKLRQETRTRILEIQQKKTP